MFSELMFINELVGDLVREYNHLKDIIESIDMKLIYNIMPSVDQISEADSMVDFIITNMMNILKKTYKEEKWEQIEKYINKWKKEIGDERERLQIAIRNRNIDAFKSSVIYLKRFLKQMESIFSSTLRDISEYSEISIAKNILFSLGAVALTKEELEKERRLREL